jgi:hypothetical protein
VSLPGAGEDHVGGVDVAECDPPLELGARDSNGVCALEGTQVLGTGSGSGRWCGHDETSGGYSILAWGWRR